MTKKNRRFPLKIKQGKTIFIFLLSLLLAFIPVGFYIYSFHHRPLTKNPTDFGVFGDYIGGTTNVILSLVNIALVAYIAINLSAKERDLDKMKLLFEISRQWNSQELMRCRALADRVLRDNPTSTIVDLDNRYTEKAAPLWVVLRFFQDLQKSIDRDILDEQEAVEWFGRDFIWWDTVGVKGEFPLSWDRNKHWSRFKASVNKSKSCLYWIEEANEILQKYQQDYLGMFEGR